MVNATVISCVSDYCVFEMQQFAGNKVRIIATVLFLLLLQCHYSWKTRDHSTHMYASAFVHVTACRDAMPAVTHAQSPIPANMA